MSMRAERDRTHRQRRLGEIRKAAGLNHRELAARLDMAHGTLSKWASGESIQRDLSWEEIERVAEEATKRRSQ